MRFASGEATPEPPNYTTHGSKPAPITVDRHTGFGVLAERA